VPKFEIDETLKLIGKCKPTVMPGVPTLYSAMLNHPKIREFDLSSLKVCISGGAGLPVEIRRQFQEVSGCSLIEGYGLSETAPMATANPIEGSVRGGSIGVPVPATFISIRSIEDVNVKMPLTEPGEICIKGPQVMPGYWNRPEETARVFVDDYFRTGDVGYMAKDGFIYIIDRLKDMIIASGFKIYPRQVEEAIYRFPAVEEVTVIGVPDEYRGEAPKAFIKLKKGKSATPEEILEFLKTELSKLELPAEIEFRDELPKTMIGKLSRKELRKEG
jgi:long-chain acyl-CoA synthetase